MIQLKYNQNLDLHFSDYFWKNVFFSIFFLWLSRSFLFFIFPFFLNFPYFSVFFSFLFCEMVGKWWQKITLKTYLFIYFFCPLFPFYFKSLGTEEPSYQLLSETPQEDLIEDAGEISIVLNWENRKCLC